MSDLVQINFSVSLSRGEKLKKNYLDDFENMR